MWQPVIMVAMHSGQLASWALMLTWQRGLLTCCLDVDDTLSTCFTAVSLCAHAGGNCGSVSSGSTCFRVAACKAAISCKHAQFILQMLHCVINNSALLLRRVRSLVVSAHTHPSREHLEQAHAGNSMHHMTVTVRIAWVPERRLLLWLTSLPPLRGMYVKELVAHGL